MNAIKSFITKLKNGKEVNDPKPKVANIGLNRPPTLQEQISRVLRQRVSMEAHASGFDTEDEADDFDVDDGYESPMPETIYQVLEEEVPIINDSPPVPEPEPVDGNESEGADPVEPNMETAPIPGTEEPK